MSIFSSVPKAGAILKASAAREGTGGPHLGIGGTIQG